MSDEHREPPAQSDKDTFGGHAQDELSAWRAWLKQLGALAGALSTLATAEIRLAGGDLRRLVLLSLLLFPMVIFTWLGLSVFVSWLVYSQSGMPGAGLFTFFAGQAGATAYMWFLFKKYRRSLTLPMTRRYLDEIVEDIKSGP